jgi:hypothetical protein
MRHRHRLLAAILLPLTVGCAEGLEGGSDGGEGGSPSSTASQGTGSPAGATSGTGASNTTGSAPSATTSTGGAAIAPGDLVISEILVNPDAISDAYGEWLEIYNTTSQPIDLQGLVFRHEANDPAATHVIGASVVVPAQGYAVIGKSSDTAMNGGAPVAYAYPSDIGFTNTGDYLALERADATIIDHTFWPSDAPSGASLSLDPAFLDASLNDDETHYCAGVAVLASGDKGTPGSVNPPCP